MSSPAQSPPDLRKRLHDGLCQQLTAALMFADTLRRDLELRGAPEAADAERLLGILRSSADEVVQIMSDVSSSDSANR